MVTIICITWAARRSTWRTRRLLLTVVATILCCGVVATEYAAEQVDSGWALSTPTPLSTSKAPFDPEHQQVFRNVLEQAQQPLLIGKGAGVAAQPASRGASPAAKSLGTLPSSTTQPGNNNFRFAVRPDGIDGWRPAAQPIAPVSESVTPESSAPLLVAPHPARAADEVREIDCGQGPAKSRATDGLWGPSLNVTPDAESDPVSESVTSDEAESPVNDEPVAEDSAAGESTSDESASILPEETPSETEPAAERAETPQAAPKIELKNGELTPIAPTPEPKVDLPPPLTRQLVNLRARVRSVLKGYYRKQLNSRDNDPWEVMHGMLAYGVQSRIRQGGPRGEPITSVGWLCYNKPCKNQTLMYVTPAGELRAKYGVGLQGHLGQLLAMLAQCKVSADYPIRVGKQEFTIRDLIEAEKKTCYPKSELTFKLLAFQHYMDLNDKWVNDQGVEWDFPRLVREELAQPIRGAACGGTHRLSSLSLTVKARVKRGEPLNGEYARAAEFVKKYHQYAFRLQNRDGSLSTSWFRGSGDEDDFDRRIKTTGHILEWLCYSLSDEELRQPRTINAVTYLANLMYSNYDNEWEVGPMCHATHALLLYDERVFLPFDKPGTMAAYRPTSSPSVARRGQAETLRR